MHAAKFMSCEMIDELFEEFKKDQRRWDDFKSHEFPEQPYSKDSWEPSPGREQMIHDFAREKLGADHGYEVGGLILKIRKAMHGFEP
jgi:hypothetical protein